MLLTPEDRESVRLSPSRVVASFELSCYGVHCVLHSFPTRRSSDLAVLSSLTSWVWFDSTLPTLSVAWKLTVVVPSVLIVKEAELPLTVVEAIGCAPVAE